MPGWWTPPSFFSSPTFFFSSCSIYFSSYPCPSTRSPGFSSTYTVHSPVPEVTVLSKDNTTRKMIYLFSFMWCDFITAITVNITVFLYAMPCSLAHSYRRFACTFYFHPQVINVESLQPRSPQCEFTPSWEPRIWHYCYCNLYKREIVSFKFSDDSPQLPQGRRCYEWLPLRAPGQTGSAAWQRCESQDSGYTRTL